MPIGYEIRGTYGASRTPCTVLCLPWRGGTWYAVEGSQNLNWTPLELGDAAEPVDVEALPDDDTATWTPGVDTLEDLERAIADDEDDDECHGTRCRT